MSVLPRKEPPLLCPLCKERLQPKPLGRDVVTSPRDSRLVTVVTIEVMLHECPNL